MYLDNAATTPLTKEVKDYIVSLLDNYYNPSSTYENGRLVRQLITEVRNKVARFINTEDSNVIFTPSGSASNTLAIKGFINEHSDYNIYYSPIAHKSIQECVKHCNNVIDLSVDKYGQISIEDYEMQLSIFHKKPFLIFDYANSEIGTIQDAKKLIEITHEHEGVVYIDCTGYIPYYKVDVLDLDVDMIGFSAHKLGALKGVGVLYKKTDIQLSPIVYGAQERGLFGGTENVIGIASLGKAIEYVHYDYVTSRNRDYICDWINNNIEDAYLVGSYEHRLPNNVYVCFQGISGESLMILLDQMDIQVSTGSACSSGSPMPSATLLAINMPKKDINSCIRITFNGNETLEEIDKVCSTLKQSVTLLRSANRRNENE